MDDTHGTQKQVVDIMSIQQVLDINRRYKNSSQYEVSGQGIKAQNR